MNFIPESKIFSDEQKQKVKQMERSKLLNAQVTMNVNEQIRPQKSKKNPIDMMKYINQLSRQETEPKAPSAKDIENQLKLQKVMEQEQEHKLSLLLEKGEVKEIKEGVVSALSYAHFHPIKRRLFLNRLSNSEIVDDYLNRSLILSFFSDANTHLKFGLAYGLNYFRTNDDYENLLMMQQLRLNQAQPQTEPNEPILETKIECTEEVEKHDDEQQTPRENSGVV